MEISREEAKLIMLFAGVCRNEGMFFDMDAGDKYSAFLKKLIKEFPDLECH